MRVRCERHGNRTIANRRLLGAVLTAIIGVYGCGTREELPQRPPRGRGIGPIETPTATRVSQPGNPDPYPPDLMAPVLPTVQPSEPDKPAEKKPPRDFGAELLQMMGSPAGCLNARTVESAPASIDISLSTSVMPSGTVAQSEVHGAGLETSETKCLRSQLEALRFGPPIENAPFTVRGTLHLTRATTITPGLAEKNAPAKAEPSRAAEPAPTPNDLTTGNPEVGAPPLNAVDPP